LIDHQAATIDHSRYRMDPGRLIIALQIGFYTGLLSWLDFANGGSTDFVWAIRSARDLLAGKDPYNYPFDMDRIPYPLPAALVGIPFSVLSDRFGTALFFGISSALLALGISRFGKHRLLVFLSMPFVSALHAGQWTPLIMSAAFYPILSWLTLTKPQVGLPVFLLNINRKTIALCIGFLALSLTVYPGWPWRWLSQIGAYDRFFPLLTLPGIFLLSSLCNYRSWSAAFLLICSIMPQKIYYDTLILWLIPETKGGLVFTVALSWIPAIFRNVFPTVEAARIFIVVFIYLPMCFLVITNRSNNVVLRGWKSWNNTLQP